MVNIQFLSYNEIKIFLRDFIWKRLFKSDLVTCNKTNGYIFNEPRATIIIKIRYLEKHIFTNNCGFLQHKLVKTSEITSQKPRFTKFKRKH